MTKLEIRTLTLQRAKKVALERGGKCLTNEALPGRQRYYFKCCKGHEWCTDASSVINAGKWCLQCRKEEHRVSIEKLQQYAQEHGGKYLGEEFFNDHGQRKGAFECACGHKWTALLSSVFSQKTWCRKCTVYKNSIETAKEIAASRGGKCLSEEKDFHWTKDLTWQCSHGHTWETRLTYVKDKHQWCPICAGIARRLTIEDAKEIAKLRNGECLSEEYTGKRANLFWKCSEGHVWQACLDSIKNNGSWCPRCAKSAKRQNCLCELLQKAIPHDFVYQNYRPEWLKKSDTGKCLEIDIYMCSSKLDVKLAVEYDGIQHFRPVFGEEALKQLKVNDQIKNQLIAANPDKVTHFIRFNSKDKLDEISIKNKLIAAGVPIP